MKIHQFTANQTLLSLNGSYEELSQVEVEYRMDECRLNRIEEVRDESLIFRFIKEFIHFFALVL
ncbi:cation-transporting P-type ATPase [Methylobacter sp. G7]|uniref:cation-transporting P-type ATPase n=1 Tax=Methylobacter sp. G7 TaxID=3230117 RepID=UPI003D8071A6